MNFIEGQKVQSALFFFAGKYVYQPMTSVCQLPSTPVPVAPSGHTHTMNLSISLAERFLRTAPKFQAPPCPVSPKFCVISELFVDDYMVKRINGKMCYVQRPPPPAPNPPHTNPKCWQLNLHPNVPTSTQGKRAQLLNVANQTRRSQALKWTTAPLPPAQKTLESMHWVCTTWNHAMRTPAWTMTTRKKRMMSLVPMGTPVLVASGTRMSALYCHRPNQWLRSLRRSRLQFDMPVG